MAKSPTGGDMALSDDLAQRLSRWFNRASSAQRASQTVSDNICLGTWVGARDRNEDQVTFCHFSGATFPYGFAVALLCDGIGSLRNGAESARLAAGAVLSHLSRSTEEASASTLRTSIEYANDTVHSAFRGTGGCTISALMFSAQGVFGANVGDSRIYQFRGGLAIQVSTDDTLAAHLGERLAAGNSLEMDSLIQYIGMGRSLQVATLDLQSDNLATGYLLSSDGVHFMGADVIANVWKSSPDASRSVRRLLQLAEWLGGTDNASGIALPPAMRLQQTLESLSSSVLRLWDPHGALELWLERDVAHTNGKAFSMSPSAEPPVVPRSRRSSKGAAKGTAKRRKKLDDRLGEPAVVLSFGQSKEAAENGLQKGSQRVPSEATDRRSTSIQGELPRETELAIVEIRSIVKSDGTKQD